MGTILYDKETLNEAKDIKAEIIKFFADNPNPPDSKVHNLADTLGVDPDELETVIYSLLTKLLNLKHGADPDEDFDAEQLKMGIAVENEHIDDPDIQKMIAKAHLAEFPGTGNNDGYYSYLKKMENDAKNKK